MIRLRHDVSVFPETWHLGPSERSRAGARRRDSSPSARRPRGSGDPEFGDPSRGRGGPLSQDLPGAGPPHPRGPDALPRGSGKRFLRAASLRGVPGAPGRRSRCSGHRRLGDRSRHPGLPARGRRRKARGTKPRRWAARPEPRASGLAPTPPLPIAPLTWVESPTAARAPDRRHGRSPGVPCARGAAPAELEKLPGSLRPRAGAQPPAAATTPRPARSAFGGERSRTFLRGRWARLLPAPAAQPSPAHPPPSPQQKPPPQPQAGAHPQLRPPNQPPDPPSPAPAPVPRDRLLPFLSRTSPTNQQRELRELRVSAFL